MKILMCEPKYYGIYYEINPWMDITKPADSTLAQQQWENLYQLLIDLGVTIELVPPVYGLPDMVFTANAALVHHNKIWLSRFLSPERQAESDHFKKWFEEAGFTVKNKDFNQYPTFEGAGDALFMGERLIAGSGFRSDASIYQQDFFQQFDPLLCELIDPYFYHLDTCFCPLDEKKAIWYPPAFSINSQEQLMKNFELIHVNDFEAQHFASNAVVVDKHVVLPLECTALCDELTKSGFTAHTLDMSEFIKAGGACKCLTLNLSQ